MFFQLPGQNVSSGIDAQFVFKDNSADDAGSVLYGGAIDYCKLTDLESSSSGEVFDMLVHIENDNTNSSVSSEPFHICPYLNNRPDCSKSDKVFAVYPGETFQISMVAVDREMEQFLRPSEFISLLRIIRNCIQPHPLVTFILSSISKQHLILAPFSTTLTVCFHCGTR